MFILKIKIYIILIYSQIKKKLNIIINNLDILFTF
jgi:hypothetical protein